MARFERPHQLLCDARLRCEVVNHSQEGLDDSSEHHVHKHSEYHVHMVDVAYVACESCIPFRQVFVDRVRDIPELHLMQGTRSRCGSFKSEEAYVRK